MYASLFATNNYPQEIIHLQGICMGTGRIVHLEQTHSKINCLLQEHWETQLLNHLKTALVRTQATCRTNYTCVPFQTIPLPSQYSLHQKGPGHCQPCCEAMVSIMQIWLAAVAKRTYGWVKICGSVNKCLFPGSRCK